MTDLVPAEVTKAAFARYRARQQLRHDLFQAVSPGLIDFSLSTQATEAAARAAMDTFIRAYRALGISYDVAYAEGLAIGDTFLAELHDRVDAYCDAYDLFGARGADASIEAMCEQWGRACQAPGAPGLISIYAVRPLPGRPLLQQHFDSLRDLIRERPLSQAGPP